MGWLRPLAIRGLSAQHSRGSSIGLASPDPSLGRPLWGWYLQSLLEYPQNKNSFLTRPFASHPAVAGMAMVAHHTVSAPLEHREETKTPGLFSSLASHPGPHTWHGLSCLAPQREQHLSTERRQRHLSSSPPLQAIKLQLLARPWSPHPTVSAPLEHREKTKTPHLGSSPPLQAIQVHTAGMASAASLHSESST